MFVSFGMKWDDLRCKTACGFFLSIQPHPGSIKKLFRWITLGYVRLQFFSRKQNSQNCRTKEEIRRYIRQRSYEKKDTGKEPAKGNNLLKIFLSFTNFIPISHTNGETNKKNKSKKHIYFHVVHFVKIECSGKTRSSSGPTSYAGKTTVAVAPMICRRNKRSPGPDHVTRETNQLPAITSSSGSFMEMPLATMFTPADIHSRLIPPQNSLQYPYGSFAYSSSDRESLPSAGYHKNLGLPLSSESSISSSLQFSWDRSPETPSSSVGFLSRSVEVKEISGVKTESTGQQPTSYQIEEQVLAYQFIRKQ